MWDDIVDVSQNPTYVILDLGCTRSMVSKAAVLAFAEAGRKIGTRCSWRECWTRMSFANSQTAWLQWCVDVEFPTEPPVHTTIDVHESGDIPILMSLPQIQSQTPLHHTAWELTQMMKSGRQNIPIFHFVFK